MDIIQSESKERDECLSKILGSLGFNEKFFHNYYEETERIKKSYNEKWDTSFNIFKIITNKYYHLEKLHSNIIASIFDRNTPEIFDKEYLRIFMGLLKTINKNIEDYDFGDDYTVTKEKYIEKDDKGYIDILINDKSKSHAIIIENKLNNAPDTDNQLAKYFKDVRSNYAVVAIVYIPLDPNKLPNMNIYAKRYKKVIKTLTDLLVPIPAISNDGYNKKDDFVHGFLNECCNFSNENQKAVFFFDQYTNLLKHLGGEYMNQDSEIKLYKNLFMSDTSILLAKSVADKINEIFKWQRHYQALSFCEFFFDELENKYNFKKYSNTLIQKEISRRSKYRVAFFKKNKDDQTICFGPGFNSDAIIPSDKKEIIKDILTKDVESEEGYFFKISEPNYLLDEGSIIIRSINNDNLQDKHLDHVNKELTKFLIDILEKLENKAVEKGL